MASVWTCTNTERAPEKIVGHLDPNTAKFALLRVTEDTAAGLRAHPALKGRKVRVDIISKLEMHIIVDGAPIRHLWVEPLSPPSAPADGDVYRKKGAKP